VSSILNLILHHKLTLYRVKKLKKDEQFDPRIVAAVEAKLRALGVDDDSDSSNALAL
jgi:hypothetical protein